MRRSGGTRHQRLIRRPMGTWAVTPFAQWHTPLQRFTWQAAQQAPAGAVPTRNTVPAVVVRTTSEPCPPTARDPSGGCKQGLAHSKLGHGAPSQLCSVEPRLAAFLERWSGGT
jgi:hypothetical protein